MTETTFEVQGFEGITFTAKKDISEREGWLIIESHDVNGVLLGRTGSHVDWTPAMDVPVTPEPLQRDDGNDRGAVAEFIESLAPQTTEGEAE